MLDVLIEGDVGIVTLVDEIGAGLDGVAYKHPSKSDLAIKIWNDPTDEKRRKIKAIIESPPVQDPSLARTCHPQKRVFSVSTGEVIGFVMAKASGFLLADVTNPASRPVMYQHYSVRAMLCDKLAKTVDQLNAAGHVVFDGLHPENLLVGPEVSMIDIDGWQYSAGGVLYPAEAIHGEICPPERFGKPIVSQVLNTHDDAWILAVIIVWILSGRHPFDAKLASMSGPALEQRIADGLWPYTRRARRQGVIPHPGTLDILHPEIRKLAARCFDDGSRDPSVRPRPREWSAALQQAINDKPFLAKVPGIEAAAVRQQMAGLKAKKPKQRQAAFGKSLLPASKMLRRAMAAFAVMATLLIAAVGVSYLPVISDVEPTLDMQTEASGTVVLPRPVPEFWKNSTRETEPTPMPVRSSRPVAIEPGKPTPVIWQRLQSNSYGR